MWEGSRSSAFYFEFLFQRYPFTSFLVLSGFQSSPPFSFSFPFPPVSRCPSPFRVLLPLIFPLFNSWVFQTSFLFPFEISDLWPFFFLVIPGFTLSFFRRKQLCVSRRKAGDSYLVFLDNRNWFLVAKCWVGEQKTLLPQLIWRQMGVPGRERWDKTLELLDFVQTGTKRTEWPFRTNWSVWQHETCNVWYSICK